ncbi:Ribosome biogenesis protein brx1 [Collariella sp. IMI 366227]|nr:Ribosome biogenesis protein brx1 [Collariella sp. IMI 366227]
MAAVYKSLSKASGKADKDTEGENVAAGRRNKQRVLILSSRGVTYRYAVDQQSIALDLEHRHLLNDLAAMLPHGRKDVKFDSKSKLYQLNEPQRADVHTMEELHFTGNCLKGSRPILSFDGAFETEPHLRVIKELFLHIFGVPQGARKAKPFIDHVMGFTVADGKIWIRNYEVREVDKVKGAEGDDEEESSNKGRKSKGAADETNVSLVEIGPRFVLTPIIIQEGAFGGHEACGQDGAAAGWSGEKAGDGAGGWRQDGPQRIRYPRAIIIQFLSALNFLSLENKPLANRRLRHIITSH